MGKIVIPYKPRDIFIPYHESIKRFSLSVAHRRAGKTVARINKLIRKATECEKLNPRFRYIAPFYVQAKDIAWLYLKHYAEPLLAHGGKINESELSITLPHNNAIIRLYGAENAERMRGVYSDGDVLDEVQGMSKSFLSQIILPSLADREGWLDASGTPKGWSNLLGELYKIAKANPDDWFLQVLKASETDILPVEELERQRQLMSDNEYEQEFECSFDAAIQGAVYGKEMSAAEKDGRITDRVKYDPEYPVYTAWDLGFDDATAIWFYQVGVGELLFIDYYEYNLEGIDHYCDVLKGITRNPDGSVNEQAYTHRKDYNYITHYVPHDAANKVQAAGGRSIVEQAWKDHGVKMQVIPATSQQNGIEASRVTLARSWFNEIDCEQGLEALRNYHFQYDEDLKVFRSKPSHDWSSHGCKAYELAARMWTNKAITTKEVRNRDIENAFHRLRSENKMNRPDPYRMKPTFRK